MTGPNAATRARRTTAGRVMVALLTAAVTVLAALSPATAASFTAQISNTASTAKAATWFTCTAAAVGDAAFFAYPLADTTTAAADVSGNNRTGTYQGTPTHTATGGCARDPAGSMTINGTASYVSTPTQVTNPTVFTVQTWFKTTVAGGRLIGFGSSQTGSSGTSDRHIYLNNTGQLVFGVYPAFLVYRTITSPKAYNDGAVHHTAATLSAAGMKLYVDGALVAADAGTTTAANITGYWRVGYDNLNGWPGTSTSYLTGSQSYAAVYTTALTATQIAAHYTAGLAATTTVNTAALRAMTAARTAGSTLTAARIAGPDRATDRAAGAAASHRKAHTPAPHKPHRRTGHAPPAAPRPTSRPAPPAARTTSTSPPRTLTTPRRPGAPRRGQHRPATSTGPADPTTSPGRNNRPSTGHGAERSTGPSPGPSPGPVTFASPSGNIDCALTAATTSCSIRVHTWTPPPTSPCPPGQWTTVQLPLNKAATLGCAAPAASRVPAPQLLSYGHSISDGPLTCTSEPTAITCRQIGTSHGFTLARTRYRTF